MIYFFFVAYLHGYNLYLIKDYIYILRRFFLCPLYDLINIYHTIYYNRNDLLYMLFHAWILRPVDVQDVLTILLIYSLLIFYSVIFVLIRILLLLLFLYMNFLWYFLRFLNLNLILFFVYYYLCLHYYYYLRLLFLLVHLFLLLWHLLVIPKHFHLWMDYYKIFDYTLNRNIFSNDDLYLLLIHFLFLIFFHFLLFLFY